MPPGDPAGYLPNVLKKRKRDHQPAYQPRMKRGAMPKMNGKVIKSFPKPRIDPGTGGAVAPSSPPRNLLRAQKLTNAMRKRAKQRRAY